ANTHLVHGAKQLEKLQLRLGNEADQARHDAALHRVAVEVIVRVQRDFLTVAVLYLAADKIGNQDLIFERSDLDANLLIQDPIQYAGDLRNHANLQAGSFWR